MTLAVAASAETVCDPFQCFDLGLFPDPPPSARPSVSLILHLPLRLAGSLFEHSILHPKIRDACGRGIRQEPHFMACKGLRRQAERPPVGTGRAAHSIRQKTKYQYDRDSGYREAVLCGLDEIFLIGVLCPALEFEQQKQKKQQPRVATVYTSNFLQPYNLITQAPD